MRNMSEQWVFCSCHSYTSQHHFPVTNLHQLASADITLAVVAARAQFWRDDCHLTPLGGERFGLLVAQSMFALASASNTLATTPGSIGAFS